MAVSLSSITNAGQNNFITRSLLWSNMVQCSTPSSVDCFHTDSCGDRSMKAATTALGSMWEKVCLCRGIWSSLPISRTVACAVVAAFIERSPHKSVRQQSAEPGVLHLTMFDHKRDLVMKSFWQVFVIELSDTLMRVCHKACALLLEWLLVALCHGKAFFSDECAVYCSSLSWNVFGAK